MEFAGFLHNMYGYEYLSEEQKKNIDNLKEIEKNNLNYNIDNEIDKTILKQFKSLDELHKFGLKIHFDKLKNYIIQNNLLSLILYGADKSNIDKNYYIYTKLDNSKITLSRQSICYILIREYIHI